MGCAEANIIIVCRCLVSSGWVSSVEDVGEAVTSSEGLVRCFNRLGKSHTCAHLPTSELAVLLQN